MTRLWLSVLALALVAGGVNAQDVRYQNNNSSSNNDNVHYGWADVLRADPVRGVTRTEVPQQRCYDQQVIRRDPGNSTAGTVLGAVIGGVLGHTVGGGDGRTAATVVGAVAGGAVGNRVSDHGGEYATTRTRCHQVDMVTEQRRIIGYDVQYRYRGNVYMSRLSYDPGDRLRVRIQVEPAD